MFGDDGHGVRTQVGGSCLALVVLLSSCGVTTDGGQPDDTAMTAQSGDDGHATDESALRAAYVLSRQRGAGPAYAIDSVGGALVAYNAPHQFTATFERDGFALRERVTVGGDAPSWETVITVDAFGCVDAPDPLGADEPTATDNEQPNLIEQTHGVLTAWYLNGPLGLEQGFDVAEPPACLVHTTDKKLTIAMTVTGLTPGLSPFGAVELADTTGAAVLRYHGLHVADATGDTIPATLRVTGTRVHIDVDVAGATFPLAIDPVWSQQTKLTANNAASGDRFGVSVALSGDTALVGATHRDAGAADAGAAYVFVRSGTTWTEQAELSPNDSGADDLFGISVSLQGDTALIGAYGDNDDGTDSGSAYVFVRTGTTWTQQTKLTASDATASDQFGWAVSVSGDSALVTARNDDHAGFLSGSAYVFVRSGTSWTQQAKLAASDATALRVFGFSASLDGDTAVIGATHDGEGAVDAGAVYVFKRTGTSWSQQAKLLASDAAPFDYLGVSVSVSGDTAVAGAYNDDVGNNSGSAYVFVRSGTTWSQAAKLTANDAADGDYFGRSVSLSGGTILVGAPQSDSGATDSGAAYVFVGGGSTWTQTGKLVAEDPGSQDRFGWAASLSGDTAIVGSWWDNDAGSDSGSAYVFALDPANGNPCNADGECANGFCRDGVCCDSDCGGGVTSDCQSCLAAQTEQTTDGTCATIVAVAAHTCRPGSGDSCDADEICDGAGDACPADVVAAIGTVCNAGSGDVCDPDEVCSGVPGATCPADAQASDGTPCPDSTSCEGGMCGDDAICDDGQCVDGIGGSGGTTNGAGGAGGELTSSGGAGGAGETGGTGGVGGTSGSGSPGGANVGGGDATEGGGCQFSAPKPQPSSNAWLVALFMAGYGIARRRNVRSQH